MPHAFQRLVVQVYVRESTSLCGAIGSTRSCGWAVISILPLASCFTDDFRRGPNFSLKVLPPSAMR